MILSTLSNSSVEDVATASNSNLWFQLYVYKDRGVTRDLIQRVENAGCRALVITVDAPFLGIRERDVRNGFTLPEGLTIKNLDASWQAKVSAEDGESGLTAYFASQLDSSLSWKDIEWLRSITKLPIIFKGIACKEDAMLAVQYNIDAIVISNHGGRQLDTCRASIEVLPEVMECPLGKMEILIDGGVRRGTDVLKALSLGAKAVLVGRPILWGLAYDGESGVRKVLQILKKEFDLAMALCGCTSVSNISFDLIVK